MRKVSQGMLGVFGGRGCVVRPEEAARREELWNEVAGLLEEIWAEKGQQQERRKRVEKAEVEEVLELAEAAGVCSFAQTIEAARHFLLEHRGKRLHALVCKALDEMIPFSAIRTLGLNVVDEGHTAAVVRAEIALASRPTLSLALLVARDLGAAAARLGAQASDLRVWHRMEPERAAEVLEDGTGRIRWFGLLREVPVVAVRWIEGQTLRPMSGATIELGSVMNHPTLPELPTSPGRRVARTTTPELRAGAANLEAEVHVSRQLAQTRSALATFALDGACERMIALEQGDVLLDRRGEVVLVGSAARSWWGALGAWPYRLAGERVAAFLPCRAALQLASEAVVAGLAEVARRADGAALLPAMLQQARSPELGRRVLDGMVAATVREPIVAMVQELLPQVRAMLAAAARS